MSEGTVELSELGCRQGGDKVGELSLKHQREKIAADSGRAWQTILWPQDDLCRKSQDFPIDGSADYRRNILMLGFKGSGYYDVKPRLSAALGDSLAGAVDLASLHDRACSEMSARAWRASRLRCLRKTAPSFASIWRRRSRSAYSRSAVRTRADRPRSLEEALVSSSRSFKVASSIVTAIVFILETVPTIWVHFNAFIPPALGGQVIKGMVSSKQ